MTALTLHRTGPAVAESEAPEACGQRLELSPAALANQEGVRPETVVRWILDGVKVRGKAGKVHLAARRVGGRWRIALADYERFSAALQAKAAPRAAAAVRVAQIRSHEAAKKALRAMGVMR
jgi:hypothetical protein